MENLFKFINISLTLILIATAAPKAMALSSNDPLPRNLFIELGKKVNPAVVNIYTTQSVRGGGRQGYFPGMPQDPFEQFLQEYMGQGRRAPEQKVASLGSGFIIDTTGLIVTNNHVIANAADIRVQLTEKAKKTYKAKVIGRDARTDVALIKIDTTEKLTVTVLGDSDKVEVGEWVAAFGNPYGHGHSMTKGIISAKERDIAELETAFPFIQTDASINPGNSGGPLVNADGEVIGVNSAIDARAQGIGFAIPINVVKRLIPDLKSKGRIIRGYFGVAISNIDERVMKQFNLKSDRGALIVNVSPGSPAERGGIEPYDIVTEFNGKEIENAKSLTNAVGETPVGQTAKVKVFRDGKTTNLTIKTTERPDEESVAQESPRAPRLPKGMTAPYNLGMMLADLNPTIARQLQLQDAPKRGVVVTGTQDGGLADQAGLEIGDIILDVNKKRALSAREALKNIKPGVNSLRVLRGQVTLLIFMEAR
ncbi:MAG: Do family serine endopeptidase [Oligoflexia bacterium]|nr:Do family serine endopeptidase [Oligoflexia bacterium]